MVRLLVVVFLFEHLYRIVRGGGWWEDISSWRERAQSKFPCMLRAGVPSAQCHSYWHSPFTQVRSPRASWGSCGIWIWIVHDQGLWWGYYLDCLWKGFVPWLYGWGGDTAGTNGIIRQWLWIVGSFGEDQLLPRCVLLGYPGIRWWFLSCQCLEA